jgi:hypothetical protein
MLTASLLTTAVVLFQPVDPLRGPDVPDSAEPSLIEPSMMRAFTPVEGRPELAAAFKLDLSPEAKAAIEQLVATRASQLVVLLIDRIDDVRAITDANSAGDNATARRILRKVWTDFDGDTPEGRRTPLLTDVEQVLTAGEAASVRAATESYLNAWAEAEKQRNETLEDAQDRLAFGLFQQEVRAAYEDSLENVRRALEGIYAAVDPTPEQREAIRTVVIEHIKSTRLDPTPEQRRATMRRVYDLLDEDRRGRLFDYAMRLVVP